MATTLLSTTLEPEYDDIDMDTDIRRPSLISLIVTTTSSIIIGYVLIRLLIKIKKNRIKLKRSDQILAILCIVCYQFYSIEYASESLYGVIHNGKDTFNKSICIIYYQNGTWMAFGKLFGYLFFICM